MSLTKTPTEILLYVPNLIGYARVILSLAAFYYAFSDPWITFIAYTTSYVLDAADGVAARKLNQCSEFGAVLDMVTDRFSTATIMLVLTHLYPAYRFAFICTMILDIVSHWLQMYSTFVTGEKHHKKAVTKWALLRFYYTFPYALFVLVLGSEMFVVTMYAHHWEKTLFASPALAWMKITVQTLVYVSLPLFALKHIINVVQLMSAVEKIVEYDVKLLEEKEMTKGK